MTNKTFRAYNGDEKLKTDFIAEITKHEEADSIVQGTYGKGKGKNWKGCAVGCSLKSLSIIRGENIDTADHSRYEDLLGIPRVLARLEDRIFEGLSVEDSKTWPRRFAEAIKVGADLSKIWPKFAIWMLTDEKDGVIRFANGRQDVVDAIKRAASIYEAEETGKSLAREEIGKIWEEVRNARRAAATAATATATAYAAYAAADAAYAAADAADAAATAATAATATATAYAAYAAARQSFYKRMSEKMIELLKDA